MGWTAEHWRGIAIAAALAMGAGEVRAQFSPPYVPQQPYRPAVSPYLNLANPGTNPAINYYGIVRPQLQFGNRIQQLQNQITPPPVPATMADSPYVGDIAPTGQISGSFMTHGRYFQSTGAGLLSAGGLGGIRPGGFNNQFGRGAIPGGAAPTVATPFRR